MKRTFIILLLSPLFFACNTENQKENELLQKENELLKRELEIEKKEKETSTKTLEPKTNLTYGSKPESKKIPKKITSYDIINSTIRELKSLLNSDENTTVQIDNYGNFSFDMGSASAGRVSGNLKDVILSIEYVPERPGCADICPEMELIHFRCINGNKCVTDPADPKMYGYFERGLISFDNLEIGKKTYKLLARIQNNL